TRSAEEALGRSLRRLQDAMPKSAEQERDDAAGEVERARRQLDGLRESHQDPSPDERARLRQIGERQGALEEQTKLLEERIKRLKEKSGADRLQEAQSAMRDARRQLEEGAADEAEASQERAQKSLEEAERELSQEERRYRSLRQHELLFQLKEQLSAFRRASQAHLEELQGIDAEARQAGRVGRHLERARIEPLRKKVGGLKRDVADKSAAVEKENAVVYTYILKGCAADLGEVEEHLRLREVGVLPQELLGDIVRRFDLALKGLDRDLQERRDEQQAQQQDGQQGPTEGDRPALVPAAAELRMVMVLQKALNEERENFFANRPDFGQRKPTEGEKARMERLYHQQGSLAELFESLRRSVTRQTEEGQEEPAVPGEGEEEGR
ncbi:MAG: hypothetical protein ACREID_04205, partial [Planctomycetota bacterium]